jgi:hypothetical protein
MPVRLVIYTAISQHASDWTEIRALRKRLPFLVKLFHKANPEATCIGFCEHLEC